MEENQRPQMRAKLPAFNKNNPRGWINAVQSLFALERGITDIEKICRFTNCLPDDLLTSFAPRIAETGNDFNEVTRLLLAEFETNPSVSVTRTLNQDFVGRKPSEILAELRSGLHLPVTVKNSCAKELMSSLKVAIFNTSIFLKFTKSLWIALKQT